MGITVYRAEDRGSANHGWLQTSHSFSFASWYDPERTNFGALRVLNDDFVAPGKGFGTHPHENMEIISIPLSGKLEHRDNMGNGSVIVAGEIQIMSAGTGVQHSEFNPSHDEKCNFLQIWIFPQVQNIEPRYGQKKYDQGSLINMVYTLVSPNKTENTLWINQDAFLSLTKPEHGHTLQYEKKLADNGVYTFIISGHAEVNGNLLKERDAIAISGAETIAISAETDSFILILEVPLNGF